MANISKVKLPGYSTAFDIEALHFNGGENLDTPAQWKSYIDSMGDLGFTIYTDLIGSTLPTANATNYAKYKKGIVLCNNGETPETGSYIEWIIVRTGTSSSYSYAWEKIGTTSADLNDYVKKGVTYTGASQSAGAHTHTYTKTTVTVDSTKKLGATATGTAVGANGTDTFVKSYPGVTSKLVTTTLKGVSGTTSVSKVTAGTAVSISNVTGNTSVSATNIATPGVTTITEVTGNTAGTSASWGATVDTNGVLEFTWTTNTPTAITTSDVTGVVYSGASTPSATAVTASNTTLGTAVSVTPYTVESVTVATANANATTVATGSLSGTGGGATVMTGLGTATTNSALTGVKVTAQPTITIDEATTNTGPVNEHVTVSTDNSATTGSNGAHTHDLLVSAS